jgi:hypothetical protein
VVGDFKGLRGKIEESKIIAKQKKYSKTEVSW